MQKKTCHNALKYIACGSTQPQWSSAFSVNPLAVTLQGTANFSGSSKNDACRVGALIEPAQQLAKKKA